MGGKIRVLLADDHAVLRSGLKLLLSAQGIYQVVGEAPTGMAAIALAETLKPDLILLDLHMPGLGGLDALPILKQKSEHSKILILTMLDEQEYLRRAIKAGACGYILKKAADTELLSAMRAVMNGEIYVHSSMTRHLLTDMLLNGKKTDEIDIWGTLSSREKQVLKLVAYGHTSAEIAKNLSISSKTVDTYRARGMDKLGLKTRATLVRFALQRGLLEE